MDKKTLTRVKLINWHYFEDETIFIHGTTLLSGENTAGKSTILDAMQFCLTTDERHFNKAANDKSERKLKGYVRCKIGMDGESYLRKGSVPSYIAMEFLEEKESRYFVLGVYMFSRDEDSDVERKWFIQDGCRLEDLSFATEGKPSLSRQFFCKGEKINFLEQKSTAKSRIKDRLGYLDEKFFELIPKAISFKPVASVKEFINDYILAEEKIDVGSLKSNIEILSELEETLEQCRNRMDSLAAIVKNFESLDEKENEVKANEILLKIASFNATKDDVGEKKNFIKSSEERVFAIEKEIGEANVKTAELQRKITSLNTDKENTGAAAALKDAEARIGKYSEKIDETKIKVKKLERQLEKLKAYLSALQKSQIEPISKSEFDLLKSDDDVADKNSVLEKIRKFNDENIERFQEEKFSARQREKVISKEIDETQGKLRELEKNNSDYPNPCVRKLKTLIEDEFKLRGIKSEVYVLCELLEINDEKWANAVEAYFNTQKFNLIVEEDYYNLALEVYGRNKKSLHSVGIVNTRKLPEIAELESASLANVVESRSVAAKKYSDYVLGRVIRCENVIELENHAIAITADCLLYQGYVARYLNPESYKNPFIGQKAKKIQKRNLEALLKSKNEELAKVRIDAERVGQILNAHSEVDMTTILDNISSTLALKKYKEELSKAEADYDAAKNNPDLVRIITELEKTESEKKSFDEKLSELKASKKFLEKEIDEAKIFANRLEENLRQIDSELKEREAENFSLYKAADEKFNENRKTKSAKTIFDNFSPMGERLKNERAKILDSLKEKQINFNTAFAFDFMTGLDERKKYFDEMEKLSQVEIPQHKENIAKIKKTCEEIFRTDFLSKMKENIEKARSKFKELNKALSGIEYGDDSYKFEITANGRKESLYKMIMSDDNIETGSLWSGGFEAEYKEEMNELFSKLTAKDDGGKKVIDEYTDYRSYLDFEIVIAKKNGGTQRLSKILTEKSGGETQIPFYIAIAASFHQLYSYSSSIRLMLLDEAFNNMDSERIQSIMELFKKLELQVLLVAPSPKIEDIGEHVDSVLTAIRDGHYSYVEEYDF